MLESLIALIVVCVAALVWHDALRSRDIAVHLARQLCARAGLQLLDQSVGLRRISFARTRNGQPGLRRYYGFEVSTDGQDRHHGSLTLHARTLENFTLPMREPPPPAATLGQTTAGNVTYLPPRSS
jgi:hypothetical protein